ncbi:MAG TPA: helix-turn-helix domain-containing protein [Kofleriaceae bacterium]|nr:helix-turn-helix domain-containing protein [Kofleriaceae bacterium]
MRFDLDDRHVARWRDEVCDQMLDADSPWDATKRLGVQFGVTAIRGVVQLDAHAKEPGLVIERSGTRVAQDKRPATMGLTLVTAGETSIITRGREVVVRAGELCLLSSLEPFRKHMSADYREHFLYLPVPVALALGRPVPTLPEHRLVAPQRGLGSVLADTILSLSRTRNELDMTDWETALGAVFELAAGVFGRRDRELLQAPTRQAQRARAIRYIEAHLADSQLAPPSIAEGLGVSIRYLHLLFEESESVGATILARRLDRCRAALADAAERRSISEIAFAWGFNDAAHFSRTFRSRFGMSPRDARGR